MEQSLFYREKWVFPGSEIVNNRSFKAFDTRDKSALLSVICPIKAAIAGLTRDKSAHFQTQTEDCFECLGHLSPLESAA